MADNIKTVGDEKPLQRGPGSFTREQRSGGEFQTVGDKSPLSTRPVGITPGTMRGGEIHTVGDMCNLNRTPIRGIQGMSNIEPSQRASAQSNIEGGKGKGRK